MEKEAKAPVGQKCPLTLRSPEEELLVKMLLPWWSKLVHRMVVVEGRAETTRDEGAIGNVEDQCITL
jgi:hypothetical protein